MTARPKVLNAIVTGASSGIGAAIAQHLLQAGWHVTGISRSRPQFEAENFQHIAADLEQTDTLGAAVQGLKIDAFVHAAGLLRVGRLGGLDPQALDIMWKVHVKAAECLVEALVPAMPDQGRIVLIGSRAASGIAGRSQYGATKAALVAMARAWASELAGRGITVNVVAPAATATPMLQDPSRATEAPRVPPIGRFIAPEDVAALVGFLLSPHAGAITGQQIAICGGASL